jgi:hypothetical protein
VTAPSLTLRLLSASCAPRAYALLKVSARLESSGDLWRTSESCTASKERQRGPSAGKGCYQRPFLKRQCRANCRASIDLLVGQMFESCVDCWGRASGRSRALGGRNNEDDQTSKISCFALGRSLSPAKGMKPGSLVDGSSRDAAGAQTTSVPASEWMRADSRPSVTARLNVTACLTSNHETLCRQRMRLWWVADGLRRGGALSL